MSKFDSLASEKEFLLLNGKRSAALVELSKLKKGLEALSKESPSVRSFEHIKARVESLNQFFFRVACTRAKR